jgi:hypothetical protein
MGLYIADIHKKIEDGDYYLALKAVAHGDVRGENRRRDAA